MQDKTTGLFISFEGNDGSGKTTQIHELAHWLRGKGKTVVVHREPGGTPIGEQVRHILLDNNNVEMSPVTEMLLYASSRAQLVASVIEPAMMSGDVIICDRFVDSSYAYQGFGRQLGLETVRSANQAAIGQWLPDITFFLDLDADTSMERRNASGHAADRLENEEMSFHRRVYEGYHFLCKESAGRIKQIPVMKDGIQRSAQEVAKEIQELVAQWLLDNHMFQDQAKPV